MLQQWYANQQCLTALCFDKRVKRVFHLVFFLGVIQNGNTALSIAKRLGYISVVDTLKVVTEEVITTTTVSSR